LGLKESVVANPQKWYGMKYPDSELVGMLFRFARPAGPGLAAIDAGSGAGRHVRLLLDLGYAAVGVDADEKMVELARQNGLDVRHARLEEFHPPASPDLVVAWGLMMLVPGGPQIIAEWKPRIVVADWRCDDSECAHWKDNQVQSNGAIRMRQPGHTLDGQTYFFHRLDECELPGYERIHWQRITKTTAGETNDWFQTVHRRRET
jgi:SAM-dependent methyltransferase